MGIKPENAMVEGDLESGKARLKLIDFGCSCFLKYQKDGLSVPFDPYTPPEHNTLGKVPPAVPSDMWRLGCTLFIMLLKAPPFGSDGHTVTGRANRMSGTFFKTPQFGALSAD